MVILHKRNTVKTRQESVIEVLKDIADVIVMANGSKITASQFRAFYVSI